jgi:integral membrane protein
MNSVSILRKIAYTEGLSFLLLLGLAMPLKYIWGMPLAVKIIGLIHGLLFILFCFSLVQTALSAKWPLSRAGIIFLASLIPFGPWLVDSRMRAENGELSEPTGGQ